MFPSERPNKVPPIAGHKITDSGGGRKTVVTEALPYVPSNSRR